MDKTICGKNTKAVTVLKQYCRVQEKKNFCKTRQKFSIYRRKLKNVPHIHLEIYVALNRCN